MAREHARMKLSIWEDDDFRSLSTDAQHLYFVLTIHPQLDYCGVADWRPARLSGFAGNWTSEDVEVAAKELSERLYVVIDERTEEVLLRSFIRNDGLLDSPNMAVAVRKAHSAIASSELRGVVVHEMVRLHADKPELKGWPKIGDLLDKTSINPSAIPSYNPFPNPSGNPSGSASASPAPTPSVSPSGTPSPTTAPSSLLLTPATDKAKSVGRGTRLDDDWTPEPDLVDAMRSEGIPDALARRELPRFRDYWTAQPGAKGRKSDWPATWRNWLRRAADDTHATGPPLRSTGDQRVADGLALAAQLRAEEQHHRKAIGQ